MVENRGRYIIDFTDIPAKRYNMPELEVDKRIDNFDEVELGLTNEDARSEAKRCLSCRRCLGCELCWAACAPRAIVFDQKSEVIDLTFDEIIIPDDVGQEMALKKGEYGFRNYKNVIDAFQFETMLDDDGPYGGMVLRPYDGDIPSKIGFVIDAANEAASSLFSYLMQEADEAKKKVSDLAISVFTEESATDPTLEGVTIKQAVVDEVKENEETKNVIVTINENGDTKDGEFDILVIAKPPAITKDIRNLRKKVG